MSAHAKLPARHPPGTLPGFLEPATPEAAGLAIILCKRVGRSSTAPAKACCGGKA